MRLFLPYCHHYCAVNISIKRVCSDRTPAVTNSVAAIVKKTILAAALRRLWKLRVLECLILGAKENLSFPWEEHTWLAVMLRKQRYEAKTPGLGAKLWSTQVRKFSCACFWEFWGHCPPPWVCYPPVRSVPMPSHPPRWEIALFAGHSRNALQRCSHTTTTVCTGLLRLKHEDHLVLMPHTLQEKN